MSKFINGLFIALFIFAIHTSHAFGAIVSVDNVFTNADIHSSAFATKLTGNTTKMVNGINNIEYTQVKNDTLREANMADEINPRIRFYEQGGEGSECEMVYSGLLPDTSASLTSDISAGTAYVRGYRINKASATAKTYTASKWTYVDIDINGDFQYSDVSINSPAPATYTNALRLARVSTDTTTINTVSDMRVTSCTTAKPSTTREVNTEASLDDILKNGQPVRKTFATSGTTPNGFAQGAFVSYDTHTTMTVSSGGLYINGKYRANSIATSLSTSADDPTNGVSGIVAGSPGASKTYNVYAVADQDAVKTFSVSYGEDATGLTNYRLIGSFKTDATSLFTSSDVAVAHAIMPTELVAVGGWINFNGSGTIAINDSYNVSGISDGGTGNYTITWDVDFANANYSMVCNAVDTGSGVGAAGAVTKSAGSAVIYTTTLGGSGFDYNGITAIAIGDR